MRKSNVEIMTSLVNFEHQLDFHQVINFSYESFYAWKQLLLFSAF